MVKPKRKVPAIPFVTPKEDKNTYDVLSAVKQWIEISDGRRGDPSDRFVTVQETKVRVEDGVSTAVQTSVDTIGTGGGTSDSIPPGSASGLTLISSGMGGVEIGWTAPADTDIDQYIIYGDVINSFNADTTPVQGVAAAPSARFMHKWTHPLSSAYTWYYWLVVVDKSGNKSPAVGPLTVNASSSYDRAIEKIVSSILDNENSDIAFKTDKIKIAPQDGATAGTVYPFGIGTIDGVTAVCLRGDLFVDGSINGKVITAGSIYGDRINAVSAITLSSGGTLTIGNDDVVLSSTAGGGSGDGRITVKDQTAGGTNRSLFWRGAFSHYNYTDSDTICQVPPRQMATGYANDGQTIEINGEYPFVPSVIAFPMFMKPQVADCMHIAHPGPVTKTGYDAGRYQFRMYAFAVTAKAIYVSQPQARVYATYSYPSLPGTLWAPSSAASSYYTATSDSNGVAKLFVRIMYRAKTNSSYGIRGNFTLHVGYTSGGDFVATDTEVNAYESYADQDWRSVWILVTPASTGRRFYKVSFQPNNFIPSRYEGIGSRIEYYVDIAITYNQSWNTGYIAGAGGYVAHC